MIIQFAKAGTTITIFDSPDGSKNDDYTVIKIRKDIADAVSLFCLLVVLLLFMLLRLLVNLLVGGCCF